jgi:hypothetical protein
MLVYQVVKNYEIVELYDSFSSVRTGKKFGHMYFF